MSETMRQSGEEAGRLAAYQSTLPELFKRIGILVEHDDPMYAVGFITGVADVFEAMTDSDIVEDVRPTMDGAF